MNLSAPFIYRPVMTTFVMLTLAIMGVIAFFKLSVSDLPPIEHPRIQVTANYTGASSDAILNQVTIPLEKELTHVKGIQEMTSKSSPGYSVISLNFDLSKDMAEAIRDVQAALNRAQSNLPTDLSSSPTYSLHEDSQDPILWFLLSSEQESIEEMHQYADAYILPRLNRLEGVAQVKVLGSTKQIWIRIHPELMASRQIGFNQVVDTIRQYTKQSPLGTIQTSSKLLSIEWPGSIREAKDLENLKIGNTVVRIKDIGEVANYSTQNHEFHFVKGNETSKILVLGIQKVADSNTVAIANSAMAILESVSKDLPATIKLNIWFDKSIWIWDSLLDVSWSLVIAFILVILVIYFSLGRFAEALIASSALPLSLLGTFIIMYFLHFSLDLLSLLALTLSVGFVVDDAIVVLENIVRCHKKGTSAQIASLNGSKQISFTVLSMSLSLVAVFIPLLFMSGMNGRLFREFSVTLSVAILVSGFISLSLTPMLCSRFLSAHKEENKLQKAIARANDWMVNKYAKTLSRSLKFHKSMILIAGSCLCGMVLLFIKLPVNLIPPEDRGYFFTIVNLPTGISPEDATKQQTKLEAIVSQDPHIEKFISLNLNGSLLFLNRLNPLGTRPPQQVSIDRLQNALDKIPGIQTFMQPYQLINLEMDFGSAGQYKMLVRAFEFSDVDKASNEITKALQQHPDFPIVINSLQHNTPMLEMNINEELSHSLGFGKREIQSLLSQSYGQGFVGSIQKGATQENIFMELLPEFQNSSNAPNKLYLTTSNGDLVPFNAFASWKEKLGSSSLRRQDQMPAATIRFSIAENIHPNIGLKLAETIAKQNLSAGVTVELTGEAKTISTTTHDTLILLLAAVIVMYVVLGILYESFIHPLTILSSIPLAGFGGALTLFLFDEPISIFSSVGFLLLIGIVKKNGIMIVDYALEAEKTGSTPDKAIYEACLVRFRPIMMTTLVAIMGALPIVFAFGEGAETRRGLGLVIIGGLLFSQMLTLYITPVIYLLFRRSLSFNKQD